MRTAWATAGGFVSVLIGAATLAAAGWGCSSQIITVTGTGGAGGATTSTSAPGGGTTISSSTAVSTGSSSSSSSTFAPECTSTADCPPPPNPCIAIACTAGVCQTEYVPMLVLSKDVPPDCLDTVCDGHGNLTKALDQTNVPVSTNPCLVGTCDLQANPGTSPVAAGTPCATGKICDGTGACVQCLTTSECPTGDTCTAHVCVATCKDGAQDGSETDVDCGGGTCAACGLGKKCQVNFDCLSDSCDPNSLTCVTTCDCCDGVKNGSETDVDCGGGFCPPCVTGKTCLIDSDCVSSACDGISLICDPNQCADHRKDGLETDVDCGGGVCSPCASGQACIVNTDCQAGLTCSTTHVCM